MGQQVAAAAIPPASRCRHRTLLPAEQAMLDQLRAAGTGPSFDMAYQQQQIAAHQQAIQMMQNYAASGDVPALRTVAAGAIPVMQKHLAMAQALQTRAAAAASADAAPAPGHAGERG